MTSLGETGEKILYPIRQPARSRMSRPEWMLLNFRIILSCLIPRLELGIEKCWFGQLGSSLSVRWWICSTLDGSDLSIWIAKHAALAASYCKLENHLVFYFNLLLIVYLLYSIKVTVFHRSLVCFIHLFYCYRMSATALVRSPQSIKRSPTQSQTQDQASRHRLFRVA